MVTEVMKTSHVLTNKILYKIKLSTITMLSKAKVAFGTKIQIAYKFAGAKFDFEKVFAFIKMVAPRDVHTPLVLTMSWPRAIISRVDASTDQEGHQQYKRQVKSSYILVFTFKPNNAKS